MDNLSTPPVKVVEILPSEVNIRKLAKDVGQRAEVMRGRGLISTLLYDTIVAGLQAETVLYNRDGVEVGRVADHNVRAKFVSAAVEVLGEKAGKEEGSRIPQLMIILPDGKRWGNGV